MALKSYFAVFLTAFAIIICETKSKSVFYQSDDYQADGGYDYIDSPLPKCARIWNFFGSHMHLGQNQHYGDLSIYNFVPTAAEIRSGCLLSTKDDQGVVDRLDRSIVAGSGKCWLRPLNFACCECFGCYGAQTPDSPTACAVLYEHAYCTTCFGRTREVQVGEEVGLIHPDMDKIISSIIVRPGCILEVFKMANFMGDGGVVSGIVDVLTSDWNDQVSSFRCKCGEASTTSPVLTTSPVVTTSSPILSSSRPITETSANPTNPVTAKTEETTLPSSTSEGPFTTLPTQEDKTTTPVPEQVTEKPGSSTTQITDEPSASTAEFEDENEDTTPTFIIY